MSINGYHYNYVRRYCFHHDNAVVAVVAVEIVDHKDCSIAVVVAFEQVAKNTYLLNYNKEVDRHTLVDLTCTQNLQNLVFFGHFLDIVDS